MAKLALDLLNPRHFKLAVELLTQSENLANVNKYLGLTHLIQLFQEFFRFGRIRSRMEEPRLGPAELRRRDHLHRLRNLLGVSNRHDPFSDCLEGGHEGPCLAKKKKLATFSSC